MEVGERERSRVSYSGNSGHHNTRGMGSGAPTRFRARTRGSRAVESGRREDHRADSLGGGQGVERRDLLVAQAPPGLLRASAWLQLAVGETSNCDSVGGRSLPAIVHARRVSWALSSRFQRRESW